MNLLKWMTCLFVIASSMACAKPNGFYVDKRDGFVYKLALVDSLVWLGGNLAYRQDVDYTCFDKKSDNCLKYGALYTWPVAKVACPAGFRLATSEDFKSLADTEKIEMLRGADWQGYDKRNFNAVPSGYCDHAGCWNMEKSAHYWTAEDAGNYGVSRTLTNSWGRKMVDKKGYLAVRCVATDSSIIESAVAFWNQPADEPMNGAVEDRRDGRKYKVVEVGDLYWFAENLEFRIGQSSCYENSIDNCKSYGRLYSWETARQACPAGWNLPSADELDKMVNAADSLFEPLLGGEKTDDGFWGKGKYGTFWTSSEENKGHAFYWEYGKKWKKRSVYKEHGKSVRCVRKAKK